MACKLKALFEPIRCRCWWIPIIPSMSAQLESWMKSYKAEELFDKNGRLNAELAELRPKATAGWAPIPMPTAAFCCTICACPTFRDHAVHVPSPGAVNGQDTMVLGQFLRDVSS
jgi:xylulose-5-phosphate/fructose-6-phosphate phosphoketolase